MNFAIPVIPPDPRLPPPAAAQATTTSSGPIGATAQTGGFTTAPDAAALGVPTGGGLASSPNVPKPGTTIDPATGKPHTAGLTRAELEAKKAAEAKSLNEMSGGEQAARQLGGGLNVEGSASGSGISAASTPGLELPGGWGSVKQTSLPGSGPDAPTSVCEDVTQGLEKVGAAAFSLIPQGLKDSLTGTHDPKGKLPEHVAAQRNSAQGILDNARKQGGMFVQEIKDTFTEARASFEADRAERKANNEPGFLATAKGFYADLTGTGEAATATPGKSTAITERKSLPSEEHAGALPGEHSSGAGALPGKSTESGVAILPDEKKPAPTLPSQDKEGALPGESSDGAGALPGTAGETGVAVLPDEKAASKTLGTTGAAATTAPPSTTPAPSAAASVPSTTTSAPTTNSASATHDIAPAVGTGGALAAGSMVGLGAALPSTNLGSGAAKGATDLGKVQGINSDASALKPPVTVQGGERTTSMASVTAISHGHEGSRSSNPSPLASGAPASTTSAPAVGAGAAGAGAAGAAAAGVGAATVGTAASKGQMSTSRGTGPKHTVSLTPGREEDAVGHPSTRGPETTRQPGKYPPVQDDDKTSGAKKQTSATTGGPSATSGATATPSTPSKTGTATTASVGSTTAASSVTDSGHKRTGSDASGKKKVGFMSKLKGEMKVISGKLGHDDNKVAEGEKLKHGE